MQSVLSLAAAVGAVLDGSGVLSTLDVLEFVLVRIGGC
jgi:hypothetical protein